MVANYCLCAQELEVKPVEDSATKIVINYTASQTTDNEDNHTIEEKPRPIRQRRRRAGGIDLTKHLKRLLKTLDDYDLVFPATQTSRLKISKRSSNYIGVSKNGNNWQSLINNGTSKVYIGTYKSELEAAIAYDFYSFAIHGLKSKRNFTYNQDLVRQMADSYLDSQSGDQFIPSDFVSVVAN